MNDLVLQAAHFDITLNDGQIAQFDNYRRLLQEWNQRLNLTAIDETAEIERRHFLDALTCAMVTGDLADKRVIDVGSGAGFPGLPLKILYPRLHLTLLESIQKKARFLETVVDELGLTGVTVLAERAEQAGQDPAHRARYDWAVARAVASLPILVEYLLPLCRVGGAALAQKGVSAPDEVTAAERAIATLGGGAAQIASVTLPGRAEPHYLVVIPKVMETPPAYPRRPGRPAKRPLS